MMETIRIQGDETMSEASQEERRAMVDRWNELEGHPRGGHTKRYWLNKEMWEIANRLLPGGACEPYAGTLVHSDWYPQARAFIDAMGGKMPTSEEASNERA